MADTKTVQIIIEAQAKVDAATKEVSSKLGSLKGSVENMQPAFKKMAAVGTVAFAAIATVAVSSFKAFADAQAQTVVTNKALENSFNTLSKGAVSKLQKDLGTTTDVLGALQKSAEEAGKAAIKLGFDDETAARSFSKLFGVTKDVGKANKEMAVAMDLARYKNISLEEATQKLILVHAGATKELKAMGLAVDENATAQDNINAIMKQTTGTAEAFGKTAEGVMQIMKVSSDNLKESIGGALQPAFVKLQEILVPLVQKFVDWAEKNPDLIAKIILVGGAVAGLVAVVGTLGIALPAIIAGVGALGTAFTFFTATPLGAVIAGLTVLAVLIDKIIKAFYDLKTISAQAGASAALSAQTNKNLEATIAAKKAKGQDTSKLESALVQSQEGQRQLESIANAGFFKKVGIGLGIGHYADGGMVPGAIGEPQLAVVHGGERVLTAGEANGGGMVYNITFNGDITDKAEFLRKLKDSMSQVLSVRQAMP